MDVFAFLISLTLFIHSIYASSPTSFTQRITKSPSKYNTVLIGSQIKLEWKFKFQPAKELHRIFLFRYNPVSKAKITIASMTVTSKTIQYSPLQTEKYLCNAYVQNNGDGLGLIAIDNIQFNHTGYYGIGLESQQHHLPTIENSVSVNVVDMVIDQRNFFSIVRSWFGHKTLLKCGVIHRANTKPRFKWVRKSAIIFREDIFRSSNTSILTIEPANNTDFGEYICEARTKMAVVKQTFRVVKIDRYAILEFQTTAIPRDYSRPPCDIKYMYYKETGIHTVLWKQESKQDHHRATNYIVQIKNHQEKQWRILFTTEKLLVSIKNVEATTKLRVCSKTKIGFVESSCSKSIELVNPESVKGSSGQKGKAAHFKPCWLLMAIVASVSSLKRTF